MKVLITFFLGLFLMKGCSQYKELEQIKIEYIANTRGFHQTVTIENKQFLVKNERDGKFNEIKLYCIFSYLRYLSYISLSYSFVYIKFLPNFWYCQLEKMI